MADTYFFKGLKDDAPIVLAYQISDDKSMAYFYTGNATEANFIAERVNGFITRMGYDYEHYEAVLLNEHTAKEFNLTCGLGPPEKTSKSDESAYHALTMKLRDLRLGLKKLNEDLISIKGEVKPEAGVYHVYLKSIADDFLKRVNVVQNMINDVKKK